jgi:dimethylamine monooxygenase subunit A
MIKYFPFPSQFDLKMGTSLMREDDTIVEVDEHYHNEIKLKRSLLDKDHSYYFNSLPETNFAQWEVLESIIDHLVRLDPINFSILKSGNKWLFQNNLLSENSAFTSGDNNSLPFAPLDWIGRQVQEDLVIMNTLGEVVAGQLCFPSGWSLNEKLGKQFMEVHAPLPSVTAPMIQAGNKLLARLPWSKPVARNNWGFRYGNQLDLSSKYSIAYREKLALEIATLSEQEFGEEIFLRVEHQTLTRLPLSSFVLFTIHTYTSSLKEECNSIERIQTMLSFLKSTPKEVIEYKVMTPMYDRLIHYLNAHV